MSKRIAVLILLLAALAAAVWGLAFRPTAAPVQASVIGMAATPSAGSYATVNGPRKLSFPQDFGPHPDFLTEWWYYTGNLQTADGRRFGFQLTFFRRSLEPLADWSKRPSAWATNQVYMAHFTLTDVSAGKFHYFERFERGAAGLAGAASRPETPLNAAGATVDPSFQVWLDDWSVEGGPNPPAPFPKGKGEKENNLQTPVPLAGTPPRVGEGPGERSSYHLKAQEQGVAIDLTLVDAKGPILQGDQGYSQKGPQAGNASLYFSQTHLESRGTVTVGGQFFTVTGLSWMDREISTSALSKGEVGWDWFALQLDDGSELMAYVLRRSDGSISAFSSGTVIEPDGETKHLARADFQISVENTWKSPHSGGVYPARWRVKVPSAGIDIDVQPLLADQELNVSFTYWEGAVHFSGTRNGKPVAGYGYVEMTGYAKSMEGTL